MKTQETQSPVRRLLSLFLNLLIAILVLLAWLYMSITFDRHGRFSAEGLSNLRYFTVISNLMQGIASLMTVLRLLRRRLFSRSFVRFRFMATVSVTLTFFTVLLFLGPVFGFEGMYDGANFWFHLVVPVLAMIDFCVVDRNGVVRMGDTTLTVLPMLVYGLLYVGNIVKNGIGKGANTNDWYGFAVWGQKSAAVVFVILTLAAWLIAVIMRLPRRRGDPE